ncbi:MAG: transcription termination/antitermination protein NusG [Caldilineae bacterium]|nr:MAG: transcription termination/antitermination protein NusG [Caldilineae bacterium]
MTPQAEETVEEPQTPLPAEEKAEPEEVDDGRAWYVVHSYAGMETKVKKNLEHRIESMGMSDTIFQVIVPTEEQIELKDGERRVVERRVFPGYILVEMILNDDSWYVVRNTPGVTGFVGIGNRPTPLSKEEVERIMSRIEAEEPTVKVDFKVGERVRVTEGAFAEFHGVVDDIDLYRGKARVLISIFGRETPVEVDFLQLEKA